MKKQFLIIYIEANGVQVFMPNKDGYQHKQITFPDQLVSHLEVTDQKAYANFFSQILSAGTEHATYICVVLSNAILFTKKTPIQKSTNTLLERQFAEEIPFDTKRVVVKKVSSETENLFIGVNRDLFSPVDALARTAKRPLRYVFPETIFATGFSLQACLACLDAEKNYAQYNFLTTSFISDETHDTTDVANQEVNPPTDEKSGAVRMRLKKIIPALVLFLLFVLISAIITSKYLAYRKSIQKNNQAAPVLAPVQQDTQKEGNASAAQPEAVKSPLIEDKTQIQITILNGTGTSGLAATMKKDLEKSGYTAIKTANAAQNGTETRLEYTQSVSDVRVRELETYLKNTFLTVIPSMSLAKNINTAEITITTGTLLTANTN